MDQVEPLSVFLLISAFILVLFAFYLLTTLKDVKTDTKNSSNAFKNKQEAKERCDLSDVRFGENGFEETYYPEDELRYDNMR